ncbi:hypothetical protein ACQJBY_069895 [Aegilops geniculata]
MVLIRHTSLRPQPSRRGRRRLRGRRLRGRRRQASAAFSAVAADGSHLEPFPGGMSATRGESRAPACCGAPAAVLYGLELGGSPPLGDLHHPVLIEEHNKKKNGQTIRWRWRNRLAPLPVEAFEPAAEHHQDKNHLPLVAPPPGEAVRHVLADALLLRVRQPGAAVTDGQPYVPIRAARVEIDSVTSSS